MIHPSCDIHPTAEIECDVSIGEKTRIWRNVHVRPGVYIGSECTIGDGVYLDSRVHIGSRVKIQNYVSVFEGVRVADGVFIGPHVCFTNDQFPRAITPSGARQEINDWHISPTLVEYGASLGANAVIVCGITIGTFALIGAGSVVTKDVAAYALMYGNPARQHGYICKCAQRFLRLEKQDGRLQGWCEYCQQWCLLEGLDQ
jgi:UDP-2-acetamido-3-amino-2,3-dideoxy-glucuronate N-acetyltransferase